jgi:hypothetical protein
MSCRVRPRFGLNDFKEFGAWHSHLPQFRIKFECEARTRDHKQANGEPGMSVNGGECAAEYSFEAFSGSDCNPYNAA